MFTRIDRKRTNRGSAQYRVRPSAPVSGQYIAARERAQRIAESFDNGPGFVDVSYLAYDLKDRD